MLVKGPPGGPHVTKNVEIDRFLSIFECVELHYHWPVYVVSLGECFTNESIWGTSMQF